MLSHFDASHCLTRPVIMLVIASEERRAHKASLVSQGKGAHVPVRGKRNN